MITVTKALCAAFFGASQLGLPSFTAMPAAHSQAAPAAPVAPAPPPAAPAPAAPTAPAEKPAIPAPVATVAIPGLIAEGVTPQRIVTGWTFLEGPAADATGAMYFTDVQREAIIRLKRSPDTAFWTATVIVPRSGGCNGLKFSADGRLFTCQMTVGRLMEVKFDQAGAASLAPCSEGVDGKPSPGFNDLAILPDGGIYFTNMGGRRAPEAAGVYFTTMAGGNAAKVESTVEGSAKPIGSIVSAPNGTHISRDAKTLYVLGSGKPELWAFPIESPGKLGTGRVLAKLTAPDGSTPARGGDGMAMDTAGNLWLTVPGASCVVVVSPEGKTLGHIALPEAPSNCAFGGADGRTLFVTARTSVYAIPTLIDGWWLARAAAAPKGAGASTPAAAPNAAGAPNAPAGPQAPGARGATGAPAKGAPATKP